MTIRFINRLRLGDCFWHCLYLRRLAQSHLDTELIFHCNPDHHWQLQEVIQDLPTIHLATLDNPPSSAIDCWIGEKWYSHPKNMDVIAFLIDWFGYMSDRCGLSTVITKREDLLADYPSLNAPAPEHFHTLLVNSYPQSGQFGFDPAEMNTFATALSQQHPVITTSPVPGLPCTNGCSMTHIGRISNNATRIIVVSTGPSWPVFNRCNHDRQADTHVLLNQQRLNYGRSLPHYNTLAAARSALT